MTTAILLEIFCWLLDPTFIVDTGSCAGLKCKLCRDEHASGLKPILVGSGLDRTAIFLKIDGSGLDRTEKICCFDVIILTTSKMLAVM